MNRLVGLGTDHRSPRPRRGSVGHPPLRRGTFHQNQAVEGRSLAPDLGSGVASDLEVVVTERPPVVNRDTGCRRPAVPDRAVAPDRVAAVPVDFGAVGSVFGVDLVVAAASVGSAAVPEPVAGFFARS